MSGLVTSYVKLEIGTRSTNWTYAPEDLMDEFSKYSTTVEMNSSITQSAEAIELNVSKKLEDYSTTEQMNSAIDLKADSITLEVNKQIDSLQQQIDGAIETFTGSEVPTLNNYPANEWTTNAIKDSHIGDLYLVSGENEEQAGFYYRFEKYNGVYQWTLLKDNEVAKALEEARKANELAQKIQDDLGSNYSTTTQMNSAIKQSADSINLSVDEKITATNNSTDEKLKSYSTTIEMNSAIKQSADAINLSVAEEITNTKSYADSVAEDAKNSANADTDEKLKSYSTTETMNSAINQKADSITLSVSKTYETKSDSESKKEALESQIEQNADNIKLKVSASDLIGEINNQIEIGKDAIVISGNKLIIDASNLKLDKDGNIVVAGKLTAQKRSKISTWETDENSLFSGKWKTTPTDLVFMSTGTTGTVNIAGQNKSWVFGAAPNFGVTRDGILYGTQARFFDSGDDQSGVRVADASGFETSLTGMEIKAYSKSVGTSTAITPYGLTIGNTTIGEEQLQRLLELI
jgi:hypothetical protein